MKRNMSLIYLCFSLLIVLMLVLGISINTISIFQKENSIIIILLINILILLFNFGIKKDNNYLKNNTIRTIIIFLMLYIVITYSLGMVFGFNKSYLSLNFIKEISTILPIFFFTIEIELFRNMVITNCFRNKKIIIILTVLLCFLVCFYNINVNSLETSEDIFVFLCTVILPVIAQEFLCSYITYKISWIPGLIFKLFINLYIYIFPIVPDLGNYLYSVLNILFPFLIYYELNKTVIRYEKEKQVLRKTNRYLLTIPLIIILIFIVILISGIFKYKIVAIASGSMSPVFERGDAIIYEKVDINELQNGDIIAFKKNNVIITHRIVKIWNQGNGHYYVTKGDNNDVIDSFNPTDDDILGKVKTSIKYVGYPTVLVNEFLRKE